MKKLINKAISRATNHSETYEGLFYYDEVEKIIQEALLIHTGEILDAMNDQLEEMSAHTKDQKHTYGFGLAADLVSETFSALKPDFK